MFPPFSVPQLLYLESGDNNITYLVGLGVFFVCFFNLSIELIHLMCCEGGTDPSVSYDRIFTGRKVPHEKLPIKAEQDSSLPGP